MKRLWIGITIFLLLLGLGLGIFGASQAFFSKFSQKVENAGEIALAGNWVYAEELAEECREKWDTYRHFWASFTDHAPIEEIGLLFSQLELYARQRLATEFAACCHALAKEADAIAESHGIAWWSLL